MQQRELAIRLSEINNVLVGSDIMSVAEIEDNCVMQYLDDTEGILNYTINLANDILQVLR